MSSSSATSRPRKRPGNCCRPSTASTHPPRRRGLSPRTCSPPDDGQSRPMNTIVSLIGAPTDVGAGARGASMGPEALRVANIQSTLEKQGLQVLDRGNIVGPSNPWQPPDEGYRHLGEV